VASCGGCCNYHCTMPALDSRSRDAFRSAKRGRPRAITRKAKYSAALSPTTRQLDATATRATCYIAIAAAGSYIRYVSMPTHEHAYVHVQRFDRRGRPSGFAGILSTRSANDRGPSSRLLPGILASRVRRCIPPFKYPVCQILWQYA